MIDVKEEGVKRRPSPAEAVISALLYEGYGRHRPVIPA
jgi:hypothetical protein